MALLESQYLSIDGDSGGGNGRVQTPRTYTQPPLPNDDDLWFDPADLAQLAVQLEEVEPEPYDQAKVNRILKKAKIDLRNTTAGGDDEAGILPWSCLTTGVGTILVVTFLNLAGNYYAYLGATLLFLIILNVVVTVGVNQWLTSWGMPHRGWVKYFKNFGKARHAAGLGAALTMVSSMK